MAWCLSGEGVLDQYLSTGEPQSHLLAIVIEQIHVIVIAFLRWSKNKFHQENRINRAGNTPSIIRADSQEIKYPV